jgi:hypothetical protein
MTLRIMTLSTNDIQHNGTQHNDMQHNGIQPKDTQLVYNIGTRINYFKLSAKFNKCYLSGAQ